MADGHLTLPLVPGDLFGGNGNAQMMLQQAPAGVVGGDGEDRARQHRHRRRGGRAGARSTASTRTTSSRRRVQYKSDTDPNTPGDQPGKWAERVLTSNGNAVTIPPETVPWPNSGALNLTGDYVWVRFVHDADREARSRRGRRRTGRRSPSSARRSRSTQYLNQPGGLRIGLFGKHDGSGDDEVDGRRVQRRGRHRRPADAGRRLRRRRRECPQNDEFEGTALDDKWEVVNPTPSELSVGGGNLTLTTAQGDVFGANFTAQNILLQEVPEGPWTATTKLDHTAITVNGQAAGLVHLRPAEPELLRQGDAAVQDRRRSRTRRATSPASGSSGR